MIKCLPPRRPARTITWVAAALLLFSRGANAQSISNGFWQAQSIYQIITDRFFDGDPLNNNADGNYDPSGHSGTSVHGGDFKGVVGTLTPPGNASGALVNPSEIHTALIESIIEVDEELMMKYFEGEEPTPDQFAALLTRAVAEGTLIPIICCSAVSRSATSALSGSAS